MSYLLLLVAAARMASQNPAPEPAQGLEKRVRTYLAKWSSESSRARAFDRLAHLPPQALEIVERSGADPGLLARLRDEVALNEKLKQAYGPPHTFTFDGREESLGDILSKLEAATGVTFYKHSIDLSSMLALTHEDAPFWEVLDDIGRKASVVAFYVAGDQIYLNPGLAPEKPRSYFGPLMLSIDRLSLNRRTDFEKPSYTLSIWLSCAWERQVFPLGLTGRYELLRVVDDQGASLAPSEKKEAPAAKTPPGAMRPISQAIELSGLGTPSPKAKKLSWVEGTVELDFPARIDTAVFRQPGQSEAPPQVLDGVTVEMRNCASSTSGGVMADFVLEFSTPAEAAAYQGQPRDLEFVPSGGQKQALYLYNARTEGARVMFTVRCYNIAQPSDLKEISLRVPRGNVSRKIPFSFREVEIK